MLDKVLENHDLMAAYTILSLVGFFLTLYVMQLTSWAHEDLADPLPLRWARRGSLAAVALSLLWSLHYSVTKAWQPWPPELALIAGVICIMAVRAIAISARIRRDRLRRVSPRATPMRARN